MDHKVLRHRRRDEEQNEEVDAWSAFDVAKKSSAVRFELTREIHNGLAGHRLNHSATHLTDFGEPFSPTWSLCLHQKRLYY